jgi:hypothetical protein
MVLLSPHPFWVHSRTIPCPFPPFLVHSHAYKLVVLYTVLTALLSWVWMCWLCSHVMYPV